MFQKTRKNGANGRNPNNKDSRIQSLLEEMRTNVKQFLTFENINQDHRGLTQGRLYMQFAMCEAQIAAVFSYLD